MDPHPTTETPPGTDVSLSMGRANVLATLLLPVLAGAVLLPFALAWGWSPLWSAVRAALPAYLLLGFVLLVVVHEALHGLGFLLFGGAPRAALHFGVDRRTLTPFAGCRVPVSARAYRGAVLLPCLLLGVLPAGVGIATGTAWVTLVGALMIVAAGGDLLVWWVIRGVPGEARVVDHPDRVGCVLLDEGIEAVEVAVG